MDGPDGSLTMDRLIYASSMVMLHSACQRVPAPMPAWYLLSLGIATPLSANVTYGLGHGPPGTARAAFASTLSRPIQIGEGR